MVGTPRSTRGGEDRPTELKRVLTLPLLTLYGVGTIVGGGFYALLGEVAARAGTATPLALLVTATVALFSALTFGELSARLPSSAGPARYVEEAFGVRALAVGTGALVILTGVVSAATLSRAIGGFALELVGWSPAWTIVLVVALLALVAAWGITESVVLAVTITVIEVGGLVAVVVVQGDHLAELPARWPELVAPAGGDWGALLLGSFLAFYAYVGFEDMVHVAEEVVDPRRTLPRGILAALVGTTLLYVAVATVAVLAVPVEELAASRAPLATLVAAQGETARLALGAVSVLAGVNGALVQIVMASRVVHGLGKRSRRARWLAAVSPTTRTPVRATALIAAVVLALALGFPLVGLASATSSILLVVFGTVNLALVVLHVKAPPPAAGFRVPIAVPVVGLLTCLGFLGVRLLGG